MDDRTHALIISRDNFGTPEIKCKPNPDVINTNMAAKPMLEVPNVFIIMVDVEDKGGDLVMVVAAIAVVDAQAGLVQENNDESTERVQQSNGKVMHVRYNHDGFGSVDTSVRNGDDIPMATDSTFRVVVVVVAVVVVVVKSLLLLLLLLLLFFLTILEYRCG